MAAGTAGAIAGVDVARAQTELTGARSDARPSRVLPFDPPADMWGSRRKVFAHWHFFPISFDNRAADHDYFSQEFLSPTDSAGQPREYGPYARERPLARPPRRSSSWLIEDLEQDIRWADAIGVDAFMFNIISVDPASEFWQLLRKMLYAAGRVGTGFRIIPNIDTAILKDQSNDAIVAALTSIGGDSMWMRTQHGDLMLGAFQPEVWPAERWRSLFDALGHAGLSVRFLPTFLNVLRVQEAQVGLADIVSEWAGNYLDGVESLDAVSDYVHDLGKQWCAPVWPQDFRPKDGIYAEAGNSRLFRAGWMMAIHGQADHAQLITWNDYSEASEVRPSTGIQYSFYDLAAYYIAWFKSGRQPDTVRDVLFYFHRTQPTFASAQASPQQGPLKRRGGRRAIDEIELLAFLTAPGEIEIELNGDVTRKSAAAGLTAIYAPLTPGRPSFRLKRDDRTVIEIASAFEITDRPVFQDLLYRGGSSSRPPIGSEGGGD